MNRSQFFILISLSTLGGLLILSLATLPANAQVKALAADDSCRACHENLYLNYDTGKWCCMCGTQAQCTDCHAGTESAPDQTGAHQGLIANPLEGGDEICQSCHPADYPSRIEKFAAMGGINPTPLTLPTYVPPAAEPNSQSDLFPPERIQPLRIAGLSLLGLAGIGLVIFGIRCYKADCLSRRKENVR